MLAESERPLPHRSVQDHVPYSLRPPEHSSRRLLTIDRLRKNVASNPCCCVRLKILLPWAVAGPAALPNLMILMFPAKSATNLSLGKSLECPKPSPK